MQLVQYPSTMSDICKAADNLLKQQASAKLENSIISTSNFGAQTPQHLRVQPHPIGQLSPSPSPPSSRSPTSPTQPQARFNASVNGKGSFKLQANRSEGLYAKQLIPQEVLAVVDAFMRTMQTVHMDDHVEVRVGSRCAAWLQGQHLQPTRSKHATGKEILITLVHAVSALAPRLDMRTITWVSLCTLSSRRRRLPLNHLLVSPQRWHPANVHTHATHIRLRVTSLNNPA